MDIAVKAAADDYLTNLAVRAAKGDQNAFDQLWSDPDWLKWIDKHCRWLWRRFPSSKGDGASDAEDLKQRACQQMLRALPNFRGEASVKTWFGKIAERIHFRDFRKAQAEDEYLSEQADGPQPSTASDFNPYSLTALKQALATLNQKEREVYSLKVSGKTVKEIAGIMLEARPGAFDDRDLVAEGKRIYRILESVQRKLVDAV